MAETNDTKKLSWVLIGTHGAETMTEERVSEIMTNAFREGLKYTVTLGSGVVINEEKTLKEIEEAYWHVKATNPKQLETGYGFIYREGEEMYLFLPTEMTGEEDGGDEA